jgi:integrase/recombinase XerD
MANMENEYIDIHNYKEKHAHLLGKLNDFPISDKNKALIRKFDETLALLDQASLARRIRIMGYLVTLAKKYLKKDLDTATREDLKQVVTEIDNRKNYSVWTRQGYRVIIKKFYRWLAYGDDYNSPENKFSYPKVVSWINCNIKPENIPRISAQDILTENEIVKLLETASEDVKTEALIAVLYESGCRIGEHGSVRLRHVKKENECYIITVKGKTGTRETVIAKLASLLTNWLNVHPYKSDPEAPLWIKKNSMKPMLYTDFTNTIKMIATKAGMTKRIYPHIFRHSRATHSIVQGEFTAEGAKKVFGWTPDSNMLATYLHLTSEDVKDKYLAKLGLARNTNGSILDPRICSNCNHPNLFNASICENCKCLLDNNLGIKMDTRMVSMRKFLLALSRDKYIKFRLEEMAKEESSFMEIIESIARENRPN